MSTSSERPRRHRPAGTRRRLSAVAGVAAIAYAAVTAVQLYAWLGGR